MKRYCFNNLDKSWTLHNHGRAIVRPFPLIEWLLMADGWKRTAKQTKKLARNLQMQARARRLWKRYEKTNPQTGIMHKAHDYLPGLRDRSLLLFLSVFFRYVFIHVSFYRCFFFSLPSIRLCAQRYNFFASIRASDHSESCKIYPSVSDRCRYEEVR